MSFEEIKNTIMSMDTGEQKRLIMEMVPQVWGSMRFEGIKDTIMSMETGEQKRLITEVVPQVWGRVSDDASCALKLKELVDKDIMRLYEETFTL
jgi:hypothetical protein